MRILISILTISLSITCLAQTKSGNTENGKGSFQYSNGARYKGEWKDGKRHGKGVITYPKGASEANTKKGAIDSNCICSNWIKEPATDTEEKLWSDIVGNFQNLALSELDILEFYKGAGGENLVKTKFNPGNFLNTITIVNLVLSEQYQQAAEKASDWALGYMFPAIGAYKGLIDASILTTNLIIENWMQDLYLMPIYQKVDKLIVNEIRVGDANFNAYIFSGFVHNNPELRKIMQARERHMFNSWVEIYGTDMYISISTKQRGQNSFARILNKMRKKYSPGTKITNEMIFNDFQWMSANDHKKEMIKIFRDEMEIRAEEHAEKMKREIIKSVCKTLTDNKNLAKK